MYPALQASCGEADCAGVFGSGRAREHPVRGMAVVFGDAVQTQMEPGDTETRGAEPNRSLSQSLLHGLCRCLPENLLQIARRQAHESGEVIKGVPGTPANGNHEDCIATEILE